MDKANLAFSRASLLVKTELLANVRDGDYQLYELLKAHLTSNVRSAREYELAVREAARLAGV